MGKANIYIHVLVFFYIFTRMVVSCRAPPPSNSDGVGDRGELIMGEEAGSVESVVGLEGNPEKASVRFHLEVF